MRVCVPQTQHYGLGNELCVIGKAMCAAYACGLRMPLPYWARRDRKYHLERYFPLSWSDRWVHLRARLQRPRVTFSEEDHLGTGVVDFGEAARVFLQNRGLDQGPVTLTVEGMWGGFAPIVKCKPFVREILLRMPWSQRNYFNTLSRMDPHKLTVAVHVRLGDFGGLAAGQAWTPGTWNTRLPVAWYDHVCDAIRRALPGKTQFLLLTDGDPAELGSWVDKYEPVTTGGQRLKVCSDMALMADADLLVCSVSSYSFWGAFLSNNPYVLFGSALGHDAEGAWLWPDEPRPDAPPDAAAQPWFRGVGMDMGDALPDPLRDDLLRRLERKRSAHRDIILGGRGAVTEKSAT